MIDYLELLLDEQEQEETRGRSLETDTVLIPTQRCRAASQAAKGRSTAVRTATEAVPEGSAATTKPAPVPESVFMDVPDVHTEAHSSVSFLQGEGALSLALQRQESWLTPNRSYSWAAGLYRESIDAAQSVAALKQSGSRVLTAAESAVGPAAPSVAQLDEVFARDARRYDNGFFMY